MIDIGPVKALHAVARNGTKTPLIWGQRCRAWTFAKAASFDHYEAELETGKTISIPAQFRPTYVISGDYVDDIPGPTEA